MVWDESLNDSQRKAIEDDSPNVAVVAGPGTGKTLTLLRKALQLIEEEIAAPDRIRIANFTKAGVHDLRMKLVSEPEYSQIDPSSAGTFHSLALKTLRTVGSSSIPSPLVILDDWGEEVLVDRLAKLRLGLNDVRVARRLREDYNSRWCIASDNADKWLLEGARRKYEEVYNRAKDILGFTTRGELTFLWWRYLRSIPGARHTEVGFPWTHLLVDEYQDLNECEHEILQYLANAGVSVFAVGDPNQSIYEIMRHAHPELCWSFPERVAPGELHVLKQSYRCPREVLVFGQALLGSAKGVPDPDLATSVGEANILAFPKDDGERSGLARLAKRLLRDHPDSRILLAVPIRKLGSSFAKEFASILPVEDRTRKNIGEPDGCRLAKALLELLREPRNSVAAATSIILNCAVSTRSQRIGELLGECEKAGVRVAEILRKSIPLPAPLEKARGRTSQMVEELRNSGSPVDMLIELTGCQEIGGDLEETEARIEAIMAQTEQLEPGKVTIMTLHGSKGTQAEWVIIPAVEPGFFERDMVGAAKEERRRLLYVGMTRALSGLFVSYAARRYGPQRYGDPTGRSSRKGSSVFIDELCDRLDYRIEPATAFLRARLRGS